MKSSWFKAMTTSLALIAAQVAGCGAPAEGFGEASEEGEAEIGQVAEPLGATTTLLETSLDKIVHIGPNMVVYSALACPTPVTLVTLPNLAVFPLGNLPNCGLISAAASDTSVFLFDHRNLTLFKATKTNLLPIARTPATLNGKLALDAQNLYWTDSFGIRRMSRQGGPITTLKGGSGFELLALDGAVLYYRSGSELRRINVLGTNDFFLHMSGFSVLGLTFDASFLYWVTLGDPDRLLRLPKGGGSSATVLRSGKMETFAPVVATSTHVYWVEQESLTTRAIYRRSSSSGTITRQKNRLDTIQAMRAGPTHLFWNETTSGSNRINRLKMASLP